MPMGEKTKELWKNGIIKGISGRHHSKETLEKMRQAKLKNPTRYWLGKKRDEKTSNAMIKTQFKKGISINPKNEFRKGHIPSHTGKKRINLSGEKHHNWKGGITPINESIRKSLEYKLWRESVFKRDDYTCQFCLKKGGIIHADHIKRFSDYPELRFAIDNGRTLCKDCHLKTDTWGSKKIIK